jgi:F-type H+-transporting ATPase subunit b
MIINFHDIIIALTDAVHSAPEVIEQAAPLLEQANETAHAAETSSESSGVLGTLGINWKLFLAQLVNFSIILLIFFKWIVKPITDTLAKRQEKIEEDVKNSEYMKHEKAKFEDWKDAQMKQTRQEAEKLIKTATDNSEKLRQEMLAKTQAEAAKITSQTMAQLALEKEKVVSDAKKELSPIIIKAVEKVLSETMNNQKDKDYANKVLGEIK